MHMKPRTRNVRQADSTRLDRRIHTLPWSSSRAVRSPDILHLRGFAQE
jgi:hypothetical protein